MNDIAHLEAGNENTAGHPALADLKIRLAEVVDQQNLLTDFQVEMVRFFNLLRQEQQIGFEALRQGVAAEKPSTGRRAIASSSAASALVLPGADRMKIHFYPDYCATNPYQALIRAALPDESMISAGSIDQAILAMKADSGRAHLFHLHWTNAILMHARDQAMAVAMAEAFLIKLKIFRELGGIIVWTVHNVLSHDDTYVSIERALCAEIARLAHRIHLHSPLALPMLEREFEVSREKVAFVEHPSYIGVYPNYADEMTARSRLKIPADHTVFAFMGMLRPYKGLEELLAAFRIVQAENAKVHLLIAGEALAPYSAAGMQQMVSGHRNVTLVNRRLHDIELQWIFNASDFVVLPYKKILTSGSALNAMSFSRPVIVPDLGVLPDTVEDGKSGIVYEAKTELAGLVSALRRAAAMSAGERARMRETAFERVAGLTWRGLADGLYGGFVERTQSAPASLSA